jgi:succinate dehydrogenase/fumarate reductase cytochrome b subunit (b558 family)
MDRTRWQKLFSLSGVVPLGAFLLLHLWTAAALLSSHAIFDRQVAALHGGPILAILEIGLILVPLLLHALYGIGLSLSRATEPGAYGTPLMRSLERVSGVIVLVFAYWHLWETRVPTWTGRLLVGSYSTSLVARLSTLTGGVPWIALGYLVGLAATVFHLVNGLPSVAETWGYPGGGRARLLFRALGILLFGMGAATIIELATGTRFFPPERPPAGACGQPSANALPSASH